MTHADEVLAPAATPRSQAHSTFVRRRDRHGRGLRGPLLPPHLPGWRTRAQKFDDLVATTAQSLATHCPEVADIEFAVEEVPPSDPAPWEHGVVVARSFGADPRAGMAARIVIYRHPVVARAGDETDLAELVHHVVVEQVAQLLGRSPHDIDPMRSR